MKYYVEYQFIGGSEVKRSKAFNTFIEAMKEQGNILKKYKSKLNYCGYKEEN